MNAIFLGVLVAMVTVTGATKHCFECFDVPHPADCKLVTICSDYEDCVVKQYVSSGGLLFYSSGCEAKQRCQSLGKRSLLEEVTLDDVTKVAKRQSTDIIVCEECCSKAYCNIEGCGITINQQPARGPLCYKCSFVDDPSNCRETTQCERGQECTAYRAVEDGQQGYTSDCTNPLVCAALAKVHLSQGLCYTCCQGDFCNDQCGQHNGTVSAHNG